MMVSLMLLLHSGTPAQSKCCVWRRVQINFPLHLGIGHGLVDAILATRSLQLVYLCWTHSQLTNMRIIYSAHTCVFLLQVAQWQLEQDGLQVCICCIVLVCA